MQEVERDENENGRNLVFALDIGTRSVIGVVGVPEGEMLNVLHVETQEHTHRAVVDGQIEDIGQTARIAAQVKERLEQKTGIPLQQVHIAAAGRVLKTRGIRWELEVDERRPMDAQQIFQLESKAIQHAYEDLMAETAEDTMSFYCVGHSVVKYELDGYSFSTLLGHRGRLAAVELIATFLPNEVVESLYTTMQRVGLGVASVTLEPIAAMNAVIPKELRLLNIALVDVGAGTSDIAVANGGSVSAYTMATVAGDEVTEQIMRELLVDFEMAERIKHRLSAGDGTIEYTDILGISSQISAEDLTERIRPAVEMLAATIGERLLEANGGAPVAVFLVGGGSRTPGLCGMVAKRLGIEENKVAIGGNNYMKRLIRAEDQHTGAEFATPMGIALTATAEASGERFSVLLNGSPVRLQNTGVMTVIEALLRGGYQYGQIMGRSGRSITFELNGEKKTVRGGLPTLASVMVNGALASVTTPLQAGDEVEFTPAVNGGDADARIEKLVQPWEQFSITLNGETQQVGTIAWLNGTQAQTGQVVRQMDRVKVKQVFTLADLAAAAGEPETPLRRIRVNGMQPPSMDSWLRTGDAVEFLTEEAALEQAPERTDQQPPQETARSGDGIRVRLNGLEIRLAAKPEGEGHLFYDVLAYLDLDLTKPQGDLVIERNGSEVSFMDPINDGDEIDIFWNSEDNGIPVGTAGTE